MTAAVKIPSTSQDKAVKDAWERGRKAARDLENIQREAAEQSQGGRLPESRLIRGAQAAQAEITGASLDHKMACQEAASRGKAELEASPACREQLGDVLRERVARNMKAIAWAVTVRAAAAEQMQLVPLDEFASAEVRSLVAWAMQLRRMGKIDEAAIPPELRPLLPVEPVEAS